MIEVTDNTDLEATMSGFTRITAKRKNGDRVFVYGESLAECKKVRTLLIKLARKFKEPMLVIANLAFEAARELAEERAEEFEKGRRNAERNADLLKLPLPVAELLSIWKRTNEDFRYFMTMCGPERRAQIEAELAEREEAMVKLLAKMEERDGH